MTPTAVAVTAAIISWNGGDDVVSCLESVLAQTRTPTQRILVDNASTDGAVARLAALDPMLEIIRNKRNVGFASGANQAYRAARGEWLLLLNQDVVLGKSYVADLLDAAGRDRKIGSLTGRLLRASGSTQTIDSAGHDLYRNGWAVNRGEGEVDRGQYDQKQEVFGVCAAAALYRVAALRDCCDGCAQPFDERFFAYVEDVDLDWRARWLGWQAWYAPTPAWHRRGASGARADSHQLRRTIANRLLIVANNDLGARGLKRLPQVVAFSIAGSIRAFPRNATAPLGIFDAARTLSTSRARRRFLRERRRVSAASVESWMRPYPYRWKIRAAFHRSGVTPPEMLLPVDETDLLESPR